MDLTAASYSSSPSQTSLLNGPSFKLLRSSQAFPSKPEAISLLPRCQAIKNNQRSEPPGPEFDRRQLLLLGLASSSLPFDSAHGAPISPPDFKKCSTPIEPGNGAASVDCCLPPSTTIADFKLPTSLPLRTRPSAHLASTDYISKYNQAYQLLRQLPSSDPRSLTLQANVHCAFCDGAYTEGGQPEELQVHSSWLFFPWHRWYLYFHERILAKLINDDSFALPFWNWDSTSGATMPPMYANNSALINRNRDPRHQPPTVVDLNYNFTESRRSAAQQIATNNATMYRQVVSNAKTASLFMGLPYRAGDPPNPGPGTMENIPHGPVHSWIGNPNNPNDEDMGALYSAARDPIFFAHHSNIDRLWSVWKSLGGRRQDFTDPDWLNASFVFYDENAQLVRVRIGDALDTNKLAYTYQQVSNDWLNNKPSPVSRFRDRFDVAAGPGGVPPSAEATIKEKLLEFKEKKLKKLEGILKSLVKRPKKVSADDYEEEVLLIEGVEVPTDQKVKFDVFINLPEADENTPTDISEYAGSFYNLPHLGKHRSKLGKRFQKSNFRIGIGEVLRELGVEEDEDFSVTIVPRVGKEVPIKINDIKIEYE